MFIFSNLLMTVAKVVDILVTLYIWIIIARVLISWVNPDPYNSIVQFLIRATEPLLGKIRRYMPYLGGLDISPVILIILLYILESFVVSTLRDIAIRLG